MRSIDTATLVGIAFSVGSTSLAQVLLKLGMERPAVQAAMQHGGAIPFSRAVMLEPQLLTGFLLYAAASIAWMLVLGRTDLSLAYPFVALGFVLVLLLSWLWLGEVPNLPQIVGSLLVVSGVLLVAAGRTA